MSDRLVFCFVMTMFAFILQQSTAFSRSSLRRQQVKPSYSTTSIAAAGKGSKRPKPPKNAYAETIFLPDTTFSQRANSVQREPELQNYWRDINLYQQLSDAAAAKGAPRFVLHDGPPYANGDLHCGHALNKILKDVINRYQVLQGKQVHYVPGWDCHGLPIELKVLQTLSKTERQGLTPVTLRQKAAAFAQTTVASQSEAFQRYGILGQFDQPYLTLQPEFEAAQIGVFGKMFQDGYIFRGRKPVHWSPSSQTALAEAELEYPEGGHVSKSIYVAFDVQDAAAALQEYHLPAENDPLKVAIWTTTPWTIPANLAVAVNPSLSYSVVQHASTGKLLVATDLVDTLAQKLKLKNSDNDENASFEILATLTGEQVADGTTYRHPLYDRVSPVVEGGDYITTDSGTGLVHTAPGHGQEDYLTGLKYGLELLSPVDDYGKFTIEAGDDVKGMAVLTNGNLAMIEKLSNASALLMQEDYNHKYPYDWRTKKPTIFRATDQWFASVEGFREQALEAIQSVKWVPSVGINRMRSFVESRGDWCISRQRSWGVPIPVFYDKETGKKVLLNDKTLEHIQNLFAKHGSDCWWNMDEQDLLPEDYKAEADQWKKGTDTMDVWFDSGSSWAGVAQTRKELAYPADLYLEGSDQHRGWFQSSLLTSVANTGHAPYKSVLTHGFVLDEKGYKMSKSLGNVVDPRKVIEGGNNKKTDPAYGADVLRLWVANSDYSSDVLIGDNIIKQTFDSYRKLRNVARYMMGNLADFVPAGQPNSNAVPYDDLPSLDKYMLGRLSQTLTTVNDAMENYQFQRAVQEILRFSTTDLSNFYLDIAKDRLYISGVSDMRRRSCQTVIYSCLEGFAKAIAPVLPHMAEDMWQNLPFEKKHESVFQGGWSPELFSFAAHDDETWTLVRDLRDDINKCLEKARSDKLIGGSLDAAAFVYMSDESKRALVEKLDGDKSLIHPPQKTNGVDELRTVLLLSQVNLVDTADEVSSQCDAAHVFTTDTVSGASVGVARASGNKCGRCWLYDSTVGNHDLPHSDICERCNDAIATWETHTGKQFVNEPTEEAKEAPVSQ